MNAMAGLFFCNRFSHVSDDTYFRPRIRQKNEIPQKLITPNNRGSNGKEIMLSVFYFKSNDRNIESIHITFLAHSIAPHDLNPINTQPNFPFIYETSLYQAVVNDLKQFIHILVLYGIK